MTWQRRAACLGQHVLFDAAEHDQLAEARAKALCWTCPVRQPCAEYGWTQEWGVYAGRTERDRKDLRRRHARAQFEASRRNQLSFEVA